MAKIIGSEIEGSGCNHRQRNTQGKFLKFQGVCLDRSKAVVDEHTPKGIKNTLREIEEVDHLTVKSKYRYNFLYSTSI
jgi:hypothetical protein